MLTNLTNFKESLDLQTTENDVYLANILERASDFIERVIVGRVLEEQELVQTYDGSGMNHLNLTDGPIVSVSSIALISYDASGAIVVDETVSPGDYIAVGLRDRAWKLPGYLQTNGGWSWLSGDQNYQITYTVGFTTGSIPGDLEQAAIMTATFYRNRRKDAGTTARNVGDGSITFRTEKELREELDSLLAGYKAVGY